LALACSTDYRIPLGHIASAGNEPDSKVFAGALPKLVARLEAVGVDPMPDDEYQAVEGLGGVVAYHFNKEIHGLPVASSSPGRRTS